ncbi:MAG: hypothetical protein J7503_05540 [Cellulomonas iranensis]|uniref:hypothetical protein n=1 Tax=Cellulomonas iranensis TaxID=76862 RepID=UPI001B01BDD9|nr:hypothetical protein [Cellulomonas iranensis]MBO9568271.1 hypothetical protein [Cellulomonas iranensis]
MDAGEDAAGGWVVGPRALWVLGLAALVPAGLVVACVPLLWREDWFARHVGAWGPSFALSWVGGLVYASWRRRRAVPRRPAATSRGDGAGGDPAARADPGTWPAQAQARARRRAVRAGLRWLAPFLVPVLLVPLVLVGERAAGRDAWVLRTQPVRSVPVVSLDPPRSFLGEPSVTVGVDGRSATLALGFPGDREVQVDDLVEVVVDPADAGRVLATTSHDTWPYTWWGSLVTWLLIGGVWVAIFLWGRPRRAAVRAAWTARRHRPGRVLLVGDRWSVVEVDGQEWTFGGQTPSGDRVVVLGEPHVGAWVLVDDGRTRLPDAPLAAHRPEADDGWDGDGWDDEFPADEDDAR